MPVFWQLNPLPPLGCERLAAGCVRPAKCSTQGFSAPTLCSTSHFTPSLSHHPCPCCHLTPESGHLQPFVEKMAAFGPASLSPGMTVMCSQLCSQPPLSCVFPPKNVLPGSSALFSPLAGCGVSLLHLLLFFFFWSVSGGTVNKCVLSALFNWQLCTFLKVFWVSFGDSCVSGHFPLHPHRVSCWFVSAPMSCHTEFCCSKWYPPFSSGFSN
jgi:hypothetical protein